LRSTININNPDSLISSRNLILLETDITGMRALAKGREAGLSASVQKLLSLNPTSSSRMRLRQEKLAFNAMARFMSRYDLILTPTVPVTAFPIDQDGPGKSMALLSTMMPGRRACFLPI
jgi:Asp-tRNA(Asn)/Glu-tRNA(Gln) amidotransferase A subunit family amidase